MKLCKDCKWYCEKNNPEYSECHSPKNIDKSRIKGMHLVTGLEKITKWRWLFCQHHRTSSWFDVFFFGFCGKKGYWFEPKDPEIK